MSKLNTILLAAAVVQLVVLLVITFTSSDGPVRTEPRDLVEWAVGDVGAFVIENPDVDAPLRVEKHDDGWVLASADGFPARDTLIVDDAEDEADRRGLLDKLARIEVDRTVVRQKENHAVLRVADDDFERRLTIEDGSGKVLTRLLLARSPNGRTTYVRREGENEVWETDEITVWNVSADSAAWVTATFVEENEDDVVKLTAKHGESGVAYVFERRAKTDPEAEESSEAEPETEWWQVAPVEARAEATNLDEILRKCCRMSLTGILGKTEPTDGGYDAADVFTFELEDGETHTLRVGAKRDDGDVHVKLEGNDYWFLVSSWGVRGLQGFDPAKLIEKAEEPAPAPEDDTGEDAEEPEDEDGEDG